MAGVGEDNSLSYVSHLKKKKIKQIGNLLMGLPVTGVFFFGVLWFIILGGNAFLCCTPTAAGLIRLVFLGLQSQIIPSVRVSACLSIRSSIHIFVFTVSIIRYIFFELINRING